MRKVNWLDMIAYRLFYWRWKPLLEQRPDLREIFIAYLKAFDTTDSEREYKVTVTIEDSNE